MRTTLGWLLGSLALVLVGTPPAASETTAPEQPPADAQELVDPNEIPSVHNTFYEVPEGVIGWDVLGEMDVEVGWAPCAASFT